MGAVKAVVGTVYDAAPDSSGVVNRAGSYYQAALRSPGMARAGLERATFSALKGGISSIGSDANVANILANAGYVPGGKDYLSAARQTRGAATYLGMQNENAASAISGLQGGEMGANLYQYGVTTMGANGEAKSVGDIAKQLYSVMFPGGATSKSVQESLRSGYAGLNLKGLGMSTDQQQMISQAFVDIAGGKNPDLASAKSSQGNQNPFDPLFRMNTSSTGIQGAAEKNTLSGLGAAAGTIETFNNVMKDTIVSMSTLKGYLDGLQGNPQGSALKKGAQGLFNAGKKIVGGLMMVGGGIMAATGAGVVPGLAIASGGAALAFGGGTPGYGSSFGGRNLNSGKYANNLVSAAYGARDAQGGNWNSTGGVHQGTDYNVKVGTPVVAVKEGIVSDKVLSADYGQAVLLDHADGYSSLYAHLSSKQATPGTRIFQGQKIGESGKSGNATGPHLHYEVWHGPNNPVDPAELKNAGLPVSGSNITQSMDVSNPNLLSDVTNISSLGNTSSGGSSGSGGSLSLVKGTGDKKTWATQLLTAMGAPVSDTNINALTTWQSREGGHWNNSASYNPLNTTLDMGNSESMNGVGVKRYKSWDEGIQATLKTLTGGSADARGYTAIVDALKSGADTATILKAVSNSAWVTGKSGKNSYKGFTGGCTPGSPGIPNPDTTSQNITPTPIPMTTPHSNEARVVNFNVHLHDVSDAQALIWARKVETYLHDKKEISLMGGK
jgi:murein DD-endopeptidase MepM/ murein hydrolase activator NlpD